MTAPTPDPVEALRADLSRQSWGLKSLMDWSPAWAEPSPWAWLSGPDTNTEPTEEIR